VGDREHRWNDTDRGKTEIFTTKLFPVPLCPPETSHELDWKLNPGIRDTWPEIGHCNDGMIQLKGRGTP
jgi:hypothetical protein